MENTKSCKYEIGRVKQESAIYRVNQKEVPPTSWIFLDQLQIDIQKESYLV